MTKSLHLLVVVSSCLSLLGCMTTQPLTTEPAQLSQTLQPKDRVEVVTKDGRKLDFKVESIDATGVKGADQSVAFDDIQSISRKKLDAGRTSLIALGVVAAAAVAAGSGGSGSSGY